MTATIHTIAPKKVERRLICPNCMNDHFTLLENGTGKCSSCEAEHPFLRWNLDITNKEPK